MIDCHHHLPLRVQGRTRGAFVSVEHTRFIDPRVPYPVLSLGKTLQGFYLLRPDERLVLRTFLRVGTRRTAVSMQGGWSTDQPGR